MDKLSIRFKGPVPYRLWRRFRRRFRNLAPATPAIAATALYLAAAYDQNLSGVWVGAAVDGTRVLRVHHVGSEVRGLSAASGEISFEGRFVSPDAFEGYANLVWESAAMRERCGDGPFPTIRYRAEVDWEEGVIRETWRSRRGDEITCAPREFFTGTTTLRRETF